MPPRWSASPSGCSASSGSPGDRGAQRGRLSAPAAGRRPRRRTSIAQLAVNLRASFLVARAFLPAMRAAGGGAFVSVGSVADHIGFPENAAYAASKYGLRGLHETLAAEFHGTGVRLTLVSPGATDTTIWDPFAPERRPGFPPRAAMLRPEDVADAVLFAVTRPEHVHVDWIRLGALRPTSLHHEPDTLDDARSFALAMLAATLPLGAAAQGPLPPHARQLGLGRARARGGARLQRVRSGSARTARGSTACRTGPRLGADPERYDPRDLDLLGFRARLRLRPSRTDLVRHGRQRVGALDRRRADLEELDLRPARPRVAVRRRGRDRDPRRYHRGRDRRRTPDHHRRRGALDRDRGLRRGRSRKGRRTRPCRCSPTNTCADSTWTDGAGSSPRSAASSGCAIRAEGWVGRAGGAGRLFRPPDSVTVGGRVYRGSHCGLRPAGDRAACLPGNGATGRAAATPLTALARAADRARRTTTTSTRPTATARPWEGTSSSTRASSSTIRTARRCSPRLPARSCTPAAPRRGR